MRRLLVSHELAEAIAEVTPPGTKWTDTAVIYLRGSVAEFWASASTGSGLSLDVYRERVRAFMREGDTLIEATRKARGVSK